jgi:hypothetical protein
MDPNSRPIVLSLMAVLGFAVAALVASLFIPFDVDASATIQSITGEIELHSPGQTSARANEQGTLNIGQSLRVPPGGEARIVFDLNQGRAVLTGPANLTLVESYRRATALGHALDRFKREYVLTLEQTQGSVQYIFANAEPSFEETKIIIRLPDRNYTPTTPCWRIDISPDGETAIDPFDCVQSSD